MKRKFTTTLIIMGIIGAMTVPAFASETPQGNYRFAWGHCGNSAMETAAQKVGVTVEDLMEAKGNGLNCVEIFENYGFSLEDIRQFRLVQRLQLVDEKVQEGIITEEQAEEIKERIQNHSFLFNGRGPHKDFREGIKMNFQLNQMRNRRGGR